MDQSTLGEGGVNILKCRYVVVVSWTKPVEFY